MSPLVRYNGRGEVLDWDGGGSEEADPSLPVGRSKTKHVANGFGYASGLGQDLGSKLENFLIELVVEGLFVSRDCQTVG